MSQISAFSIQNCITRAFLILMSSLFLLYPGTQGFGEIAQAKYQMFLLLCGGYTALMLLLLAESALVSGKKCRNLKAVLKENELDAAIPCALSAIHLAFRPALTVLSRNGDRRQPL